METEEHFDPENRWLCPNGACTGLLGPDGKCKACGAQGEVPTPYRDAHQPLLFKGEEPLPPVAPIAATATETATATGDEWDDRQLCPDGSCTGVIGADGRCKECGRTLE